MAADDFDLNSFLDTAPTSGADVGLGEGFVDTGKFDTSGGAGSFWDFLPSKEQFGTFSKDLKAGLSDVTKLDAAKDANQQQRLSSAQGGAISGAQAVRGQAPVSIEDLLNELMQRRAAYAKLGLQPGPFEPRAPGGGLLSIAG